MRYASIRKLDVSNGEGIGIALFVQGCNFHCFNCFNSETWDFNGGEEWTDEIQNRFIELASPDYIKRISILGGEPLAGKNVETVLSIIKQIRSKYGNNKKIWLYTGYRLDDIDVSIDGYAYYKEVLKGIDVLVDGKYVDALKDRNLKFRGSKNQRLIDMKKTIEKGETVLYDT